jgi:aryl-alcohol dehydrogenase-like predicted oxidoreductase
LTLKGKEELDRIQALTKWVPQPGRITRTIVDENIERSLRRMSVSSLDLLQFHWWDYNNPYYMDALRYLTDLRYKGIIKHIGLTNFDTEPLQIMIDSKLQIVSNQVQYSITDRRQEVKIVPFCLKHNISLLAYGSLCGGLMSECFLGRMQPSTAELNTLSTLATVKQFDN